ncbi:hypothetical protein BUALT_Bualt14G0000700 [Buddleja alternifolia]|uniref:F-box associated beta-propeller type 1 domain-containing protein n=1 Tax=Buddleja alternifolia TaxID=168488 RepID=A0AAV6WKB6_9LAMI|nr:hypothetical protein BUALT_Bualt14G0000700 [Buddleja alternifolia]
MMVNIIDLNSGYGILLSKKIKTLFSVQDAYQEKGYYMYNHEVVGLGFHESSNDHRVVRIIYVIDDTTRSIGHVPVEVVVYSLNTDLWHKVDSRPGRLIGFSGGCFLYGANHWLATTRFTLITWTPEEDYLESILLFDFEDECFKEMVLPEDLHYMIEGVCYFNEFKGSSYVLLMGHD